jgi:hypothetical protein
MMTPGTSSHGLIHAILYAVIDSYKQFTPCLQCLIYNYELRNA